MKQLKSKINKVFLVGLGGAGQRHLRIFRKLLPPDVEFSAYRSVCKTPLLNSDFSIKSGTSLEKEYHLNFFTSLESGFNNNPDLAVISTPTALHFDVAYEAAKRKVDVFVEKPFSHNLGGFDNFKSEVLKQGIRFFISYQRRFHPQMAQVKKIISERKIGKLISATFEVFSYVPSWHPYEDFRKLYACRQDLGGGVLLTEIHEIDLCYWYFGLPKTVYCVGGNRSGVSLDVEDTAQITLDYGDFSVQLSLCFMSKFPRRGFQIVGSDGHISWSSEGDKLTLQDADSRRETLVETGFSNENLFVEQADYFLNKFDNRDHSYLDSAQATLSIVEACKMSMASGKAQVLI